MEGNNRPSYDIFTDSTEDLDLMRGFTLCEDFHDLDIGWR